MVDLIGVPPKNAKPRLIKTQAQIDKRGNLVLNGKIIPKPFPQEKKQ